MVDGAIPLSASGGDAELLGNISASSETGIVLGFSMTGTTNPSGAATAIPRLIWCLRIMESSFHEELSSGISLSDSETAFKTKGR